MNELFKFHKLNKKGQERAKDMAERFSLLVGGFEVDFGIKDCREWSVAKTKLEEACFFAKKAMAVQIENQESVEGGSHL